MQRGRIFLQAGSTSKIGIKRDPQRPQPELSKPIILEKCKDDLQREFYIRMTRKFGWTNNVLVHQIENQTCEKILLNQTTFDRTVSAETPKHAKLAVKDEYTLINQSDALCSVARHRNSMTRDRLDIPIIYFFNSYGRESIKLRQAVKIAMTASGSV